jgi:hypothetical protein
LNLVPQRHWHVGIHSVVPIVLSFQKAFLSVELHPFARVDMTDIRLSSYVPQTVAIVEQNDVSKNTDVHARLTSPNPQNLTISPVIRQSTHSCPLTRFPWVKVTLHPCRRKSCLARELPLVEMRESQERFVVEKINPAPKSCAEDCRFGFRV